MSEASHAECPVCGLVEYACICDEEPVVAGAVWKERCQVLAAENARLREDFRVADEVICIIGKALSDAERRQ